jgi:ATP-dependent DNA helicase RecQ
MPASKSKGRELTAEKVGELYGLAVAQRFERLRVLRLTLARQRGWVPFQILHNTTLIELAHQNPRTLHELVEVKGIGPKKAESFGHDLLAALVDDTL